MTEKKIVFSGIQPSGNLHLGNYLGAIKRWVADQDRYDSIFCVVDMHAITLPQDPGVLRANIRELMGLLVACGIDPERSVLFVQSHVTAHAELAWILNCVTPVGWLERMTQYKEKAAKQDSVGTGLLDYPVLQAADILLYQAHLVPVGEDQRQHVELTRDIAGRFNYLYGETFVLPEALIATTGAKIMGLDDPTSKMSKSDEKRYHAIGILDEPDEIRAAVRRAVTDSGREIIFSDNPEKAGVHNLLTIYQLLSGQSEEEIEDHFSGKGYGNLKREVAEIVIEALRPIQRRYQELAEDPATIDDLMRAGAEEAGRRSAPTLRTVKERVGFLLPNA
ncbi:MAG: tryptophan--tRNA ligase [Anaerolineae bacterium]